MLSSLNEAVEAGIREVIIVAGPEDEALFRKLFSRNAQLESHMAEKGNFRAVSILQDLADKGARLLYVVQKQPRGPGDAVVAASEHVGNRHFAVMMPDDIFFTGRNPGCLAQMMKAYEGKAENIMCAIEVPEADIVRYGIIECRADVDGSIFATDVTEKPPDLKTVRGSRMAIMGRDICHPGIMRISQPSVPAPAAKCNYETRKRS